MQRERDCVCIYIYTYMYAHISKLFMRVCLCVYVEKRSASPTGKGHMLAPLYFQHLLKAASGQS